MAVVVFHADSTAAQDKYFGARLPGGLIGSGHLGIDLFFVISGFVITLVSLDGPGLAPR